MSGFPFFLSPYLQNAARDSPGDSVTCSEHHVWSSEPHPRSSPGRIFLSGNPNALEPDNESKAESCWVTSSRVAVLPLSRAHIFPQEVFGFSRECTVAYSPAATLCVFCCKSQHFAFYSFLERLKF